MARIAVAHRRAALPAPTWPSWFETTQMMDRRITQLEDQRNSAEREVDMLRRELAFYAKGATDGGLRAKKALAGE